MISSIHIAHMDGAILLDYCILPTVDEGVHIKPLRLADNILGGMLRCQKEGWLS